MISKNTALILIDVQKGFDDPMWGKRNNLNAENNMARLLYEWRKHKMPVCHIYHESKTLNLPLTKGSVGTEIKDIVKPIDNEPSFNKQVNSALIDTGLENYLRSNNIKDLVIVGLTTDHCVSTTARMAENLGFSVIVSSDGTATFDRKDNKGKIFKASIVHELALVHLNGEFATIMETDEIIKQIKGN